MGLHTNVGGRADITRSTAPDNTAVSKYLEMILDVSFVPFMEMDNPVPGDQTGRWN